MGKIRVPPSGEVGNRYGKLVVVEILPYKNSKAQVRAQCDCGGMWEGKLNGLRTGNTTSCGCSKKNFEDLTGQKFGRWLALECTQKMHKEDGVQYPTKWLVKCECGSISEVQAGALKKGLSLSCGCLAREQQSAAYTTHGMTHSSIWNTWNGIKQRTGNPANKDYGNYGGRGIKMCQEWFDSFEAFYAYVGDRPQDGWSLDRIDNNRGYEPGNIRWADDVTQQNNSRNNRLITIDGVTKNLAQWCAEYDVDYTRVAQRLNVSGWEPIVALTTPTTKPFTGTGARS